MSTNSFGLFNSLVGFNSPSTTANVFGQSAPVSSSSLFGSPSFNQPAKQATFGVGGGTSSFGSPNTSMFGQTSRMNGSNTASMFAGSTPAVVSPFSTTTGQVQGTSVPFNAITGTDTMMKNGVPSPINTRHQCITCMKEYETRCLEELRFEDYQLGRKGSSQASMFGSTPTQQSSGLFSTIPAGANTTNTFGQRSTTFGTTQSGGLFQNLNQPKANFFSSTPTTSSTFGTSFSFSNPANQTPGIFGQSGNPTSTVGTLGTNPGFSFSQPVQQQPSMSLFGQKPLTAPVSSTAPTFTGFGLPQSSTLNKPLAMFGTPNSTSFGTATPAFNQPSAPTGLFGNTTQQQPKPFNFSGFGTTPQPAFGSTGTSTFSFNNPSSSTNLGFTPTAAPTFGTSTSTGFAPFGTNAFSLGAQTNNTGFGTPSFSFNNPSSSSTGFWNGLNLGASNQMGQLNIQQPTPPTGPVPFATTPYKDSPLFYNLITNRNLDDMTKPTNPLAQRAIKEASRRRASSNLTSSVPAANIRNLTFPVSRNQIFNKKHSIFDGFEEEDRGTTIDILSPKTSVKKLTIKNIHSTSRNFVPSLNSNAIMKATNSPVTNLNESGRFDVDVFEGSNTSRPYISDSYNEILNSGLDESNATLEDYSINASAGDCSNRFHVPSPDPSFNDGHSREQLVYDSNNTCGASSSTNGGLSCGLISTRPGYYIQPPLSELENLTTDNGMCLVRGFVIGRHNYGQIRFLETVNVAGINLDEIFLFRHKEVNVYPDDDAKPPVGHGINCAAEIKMERVWPIDKDTRNPIKSPAKIRALNYEEKLKRSCRRMGAEFISYDHDTGVWIFRVLHFSKYSCVPEENEDDDLENLPPVQLAQTKGLGGITSLELKSGILLSPHQSPQSSQPPLASDVSASGEGTTILKPRSWSTPVATPLRQYRKSVLDENEDDDLENLPPIQLTQAKGLGSITSFERKSGVLLSPQPPQASEPSPISEIIVSGEGSTLLKPISWSTATSIPLRQYRKKEEVRRGGDMLCPSVSMFSDLKLYPGSVSSRRRGSRVSFGPGGHFIRAKSSSGKINTQVEIMRCESYALMLDQRHPSFYKRAVQDQLEFQFTPQSGVAEGSDQFVLEPGGNVSSQIEFLQLFSQQQHSDYSCEHFLLLREERQVWSLCKILWPDNALSLPRSDPEFLSNQREKLVRWFEVNGQMLFGNLYDTTDKSVKGYLMRGMKSEACEQAIHEENLTLALCLAEDSIHSQSSCRYQVTQWEVEGASGFIPPPTKILYELCAGLVIWEDVDFQKMTTAQWLQHFAIYLWYIALPHETIQEIVTHYQCLILESAGTHSEEQGFPKEADSSLSNLCIHLLKTFAFTGYPLKNLLNPTTNNPDCLDYKLSWLLMLNMEKFGGYTIDSQLRENITCGFAGQLEKLGLFQWAVYVVKHLELSENRGVLIRRILERNLVSLEDNENEVFMVNCLGVEYQEIFAAKTLRASREGRTYHEMWYLLKSKQYDEAFKIFVNNIKEIYFTTENIRSLNALLQEMYLVKRRIYDWERHGQSVHSLFGAVNLLRKHNETKSGNICLGSAEIRKNISDMLYSISRVQSKKPSEIIILLELCATAKNITQLLLRGTSPINLSSSHFPSLDLLNTKCLSEYMEEARFFFNNLRY